MQFFAKWTATAVASAALIGCGATSYSSIPRYSTLLQEQTQQDGRACVRNYQIRGYNVKHRDIITIDAGRKQYVATTFSHCPDLELSFQAAFVSRFSQICGGSGRVVTRSENCLIDKMFEFDDRESAKAAVQLAFDSREQARANAKELREISKRADEFAAAVDADAEATLEEESHAESEPAASVTESTSD